MDGINPTTAPNGVAVLATQLPRTDRRALSEAWYSALHLTAATRPGPQAGRARSTAGASPPRRPGAAAAAHATATHAGTAPPKSGRSAAGVPTAPDRREPKSDLARRIERAVVRRSRAPRRPASIALKAAGGRVQLLVRTDGAATRIVALCAPPLRERVERALAQARFALAAGGRGGAVS